MKKHFTAVNQVRLELATSSETAGYAGAAAVTPEPKPKPKQQPEVHKTWTKLKYCWSCGLGIHLGEACHKPMKGHDKTATLEDRKGGCDLIDVETVD